MRIALFTPFSPDTGGGAVQIKSLLPELKDLDIKWYYLSPREATSYAGHWLGPPLSAPALLCDLMSRTARIPGSKLAVKQIVSKLDANFHWVIAHNEGVLVADQLCSFGKNVHLTVHDDPAEVFAMSRKYWAFQRPMTVVFARALKAAVSSDAISSRMSEVHKRLYSVESFPLYRYVAKLAPPSVAPAPDCLKVGHIGTLYQAEPFRAFVYAAKRCALLQHKRLSIVRIGGSREIDKIAAEHPCIFDHVGELDEESAIKRLHACDFVYAMYPPGERFERFRQTSLPMKLSTYIQAQRTIFAHTPLDSTLATVVSQHGLGVVCSSAKLDDIQNSIRDALSMWVSTAAFEAARAALLGLAQVGNIRRALGG